MAKTISQAQAEALAEGFLDSIGTDADDELRPKKSMSKLILMAGFLVEMAQKNLNSVDRVSSGALSSSITILDPVFVNKKLQCDISLLYYYKFIDGGVKGTRRGSGLFQFQYEGVSPKFLKALLKWLKKEGLKAKTNVQGKSITKREAKRKSITDITNRAAYAIGVSIKRKGLKRTNFFANAIKETQQRLKDEMGKSFKADIIETLPKKLNAK